MHARLCLGCLLGVVLVVGCETTQPVSQNQQLISLGMVAPNAIVQSMSTWTVFEDSDGNDFPDDSDGDGQPDVYLWCQPEADYVAGSKMPWSFSVQVDRVPDGQAEAVTVAYDTDPLSSFTTYDDGTADFNPVRKDPVVVTHPEGRCRFQPQILCNPDVVHVDPQNDICVANDGVACDPIGRCSGDASVRCDPNAAIDICNAEYGNCEEVTIPRTFKFVRDRVGVSGAHEDVLTAENNIVFITDPAAALAVDSPPRTGGVCPGVDLGAPNIGGNDMPWSFLIDRGDTVVVGARWFPNLPSGFAVGGVSPPTDDPFVVYINGQPSLISASITVDGRPTSPVGSLSAEPDQITNIHFYFNSQ